MRTLSAVVAASLFTVGCSPSTAHRVRRPAELALGASLIGVMASASAIGAFPDHKPVLIGITAGFGALALASLITYGVAYSNEPAETPPPAPPPPPDHRGEAWTLTQQAQAAARAGDCAQVEQLDGQVGQLDAEFHAAVFVRDVAIARCLQSSSR